MKKMMMILIVIFLGFSATAQGQVTATYDDVITKRKKGRFSTYIANSGEIFKVGDTLTLGVAHRNEQFDFIYQNAGIEFYPLPNTAAGSKVVIKKIRGASKLCYVYTTKPQGFVYGLLISNFDGAVSNGEVLSKIMTSDQALEELKKWKSKLDLEIITQAEYDEKKSELMKIIK